MIIIKILIFFLFQVNSYYLCIVGGSSGIGKELIYQSLENNNKILALTNNSKNIKIPYRGGGLSKEDMDINLINNNLKIDLYKNYYKYNFKNIVFTTGAQPFKNDYSDIITKDILSKNLKSLKNIILLSAEGVAETLPNSNIGIKVMNNWYLKDTYRAKNEQEKIVNEYSNKYNKNLLIIRPKALSYGVNLYGIKSRKNYAEEILEYLKNC